VVAIGFAGPQDLQGPRDQGARKAIPASPDQLVQPDPPVQSGQQARKVLPDPGDLRVLLELLHNNGEAAAVGGLAFWTLRIMLSSGALHTG
jgi:hypothetical protein